jgi:hypothetical protein
MKNVDTKNWSRIQLVDFYSGNWGCPVIPMTTYQVKGEWKKKPAVHTWEQYKMGSMPTSEDYKTWFIDNQCWGLGIVNLHNIFAPDMDSQEVYDLLKDRGALEGAAICKTPHGYRALLQATDVPYTIAEGFLKGIDAKFEHLCIKGGNNSLSILPDTPAYAWVELPEKLTKVSYEDWVKRYLGYVRGAKMRRISDVASRSGNWVTEAMKGVKEGERDNMCLKLASHYRAKGLSAQETMTILNDWALRCTPAFDDVEKCVNSAYRPEYSDEQTGAVRLDNRPVEASFIRLPSGVMAEEVRDPVTCNVRFAVYNAGQITYQESLEADGKTYVPINNDAVQNKGVLFPSEAVPYGSFKKLHKEVQDLIHKWVYVSPQFEMLASYYAMLSWVYDAYPTICYLRFLGNWGTGKSRGMNTISSLCYKPMRMSGASTISPIFRVMEMFHGTLVMDEADRGNSDEYNEYVKILNTGIEKETLLWRSEKVRGDKLEPKSYNTFGPKIVAARNRYGDQALESRFITEETNKGFDKTKYTLHLTDSFYDAALALRNKLLYFRLTMLQQIKPDAARAQPGIEPRVSQVMTPLLQLIEDKRDRAELVDVMYALTQQIREDRGESPAGELVAVLYSLEHENKAIPLKDIYGKLAERAAGWTPRKVGNVCRLLGLKVKRSHGSRFVDLQASEEAMKLIRRQYPGIDNTGEAGADRDEI